MRPHPECPDRAGAATEGLSDGVCKRAEIFGDATAVEAMVDRLVHHAEVIVLQGESYRLKDRTKEVAPKKSR